MLLNIEAMRENLRVIRLALGTTVKRDNPNGAASAIVIEDGYRIDDDVVAGGQNFKGEDGKRGTV